MPQSEESHEKRRRKYPAKGVHRIQGQPTIVFVTVCSHKRKPWLANAEVHGQLKTAWGEADGWHVGRYVVMPDHIHLFAAPGDRDIEVEHWVGYWKSLVTRSVGREGKGWQKECWHHRLRCGDSYQEKWHYVLENPVRKGLVKHWSEWPYRGERKILAW